MNLDYLRQSENFFLMAGPCVIEGEDMALRIAERVVKITDRLHIPYIFKGSYRKANRSRIDSFTGIGDERALRILARVRSELGVPVVTDIHEAREAAMAAEYVDVLQIPAFLCRQTDLLVAAARTGRIVNIKKAQFLSGLDMQYPVQKVLDTLTDTFGPDYARGHRPWLTERGNMYGYNNLVVDFRNLPLMHRFTDTVIMDCTHSVQRPGGAGGTTGGNREYVPAMALAAKAFGADGYFFEVHPDPDRALSDGPNMLPLNQLEPLVRQLLK